MRKPKPVHVSFDSNILRQDRGFSKADMKQLAALAKLGLIKMHFLWFVYMECISTYKSEIEAEINSSITSIKDLSKKGLHKNQEKAINKLARELNKQKDNVMDSIQQVWEDYINETGSEFHHLDNSHTMPVFENYFSGSAPYSGLKKREDIPDAFILESLKDISSDNHIHFICNDKNLSKHAAVISNVTVHTSIDLFLKSKSLEFIMKFYNEVGRVELRTIDLNLLLPEIAETISFQVQKWKHFDCYIDYPYSNDDHVSVNAIDDAVVSFQSEDIRFIDDEFYVPYLIKGQASINFFVDISDVLSAVENERLPPLSTWNEYVMWAEDIDEIIMTGTLRIPISYLKDHAEITLRSDDIDEFSFGALENLSENKWRSTDL
ncbi:MAG: PIN domain-containing protein [Sediminibacterium sp.]|nr:PIN domain-containing protein [Sediminibacterium sp.]